MAKFSSEITSLVKLAAPVSLAQLCLVGMSATDVLIAGHAGTVELAGMNLGANTWNMVILFFMGVGFATQPLVAKEFGAHNDAGIKHQLHQSIWMCFSLGIIAMLVVWLCVWALAFAPFELEMLRIATDYLFAISLCAIPMTLIPALRGTLEGMSLTRVVFFVNFAAFLLNIPLDYIFVNGLYGFPRLGGVGCAWATVFLMWSVAAINALILHRHSELKTKNLFTGFESPYRETIRKTMRLGLPIGVSIIIELSMFAGAGMLIATFGVVQASAHAVAITVASMSFMLYMGLGQGVTIRASQLLGAGCALRAYHDTSSPPKYQFVSFLVFGLPIGIGLAFYNWWPGMEGAKGMWFAMVISLFMVGFLLLWRLATRARVIQ